MKQSGQDLLPSTSISHAKKSCRKSMSENPKAVDSFGESSHFGFNQISQLA